MHFWPNPSITKTLKAYNLREFRSKRPKGLTDAEWATMRAEELLNKQIALNTVPKMSKSAGGPKRASKED
jgi:hypothetical protein